MTRAAFFAALLIGTAPAASTASPETTARDAANWDVVLNQYPERARAAGEQGAVAFRVTLDKEGYASACEVTQTSGHPLLDDETCQLILNRATFKGVKTASGRKVSSVHDGVINWKLPQGQAAAVPQPTFVVADAGKSEKKICKRRVKTGSLAGYERLCATEADWARMGDRTREEWGAVQGTLGNTKGN